MRQKTWLAALTAAALTLATIPPALADISVQLNGQPLAFDVPPVVQNGRTLVPVRAIFEALGARITWDPASQTISAVHPERDRYVILTIGSTTSWVDGRETKLDVAPQIIEGRTLVPLRFISTAMGAEVGWDPVTETVTLTQEPLPMPEGAGDPTQPAEETPAAPETPAVEERPADASALSRFTRSVAFTHLDATFDCTLGMAYRFEEIAYSFVENGDLLEEHQSYLAESLACWNEYEQNLLPTLPMPAGAEAAHQALQLWVDLNQDSLTHLQASVEAHQKGDIAERDRLFLEGQQILEGAAKQGEQMSAAMDAITSPDTQFLTVSEHLYAAWLDDFMGSTDNCFYQLNLVNEGPEENPYWVENNAAYWSKAAADCMIEMPEILSEMEPPTALMLALRTGVLAELAQHTPGFSALAAKLQAGAMAEAELAAEMDAIYERWYQARERFDQLFVYRTYGAE